MLVTSEQRNRQVAGTVFGIISNPFWWMMMVATEQWLTIPVHAVYTYGWVRLAYRLWRTRGA
jgi:hypothetical protein